MSRDKFKSWARTKGFDLDEWDGDFESLLTIAAYQGWLAGRESMQDEAALEAEQGIWMCKTSEEIIDSIGKAIREIEL